MPMGWPFLLRTALRAPACFTRQQLAARVTQEDPFLLCRLVRCCLGEKLDWCQPTCCGKNSRSSGDGIEVTSTWKVKGVEAASLSLLFVGRVILNAASVLILVGCGWAWGAPRRSEEPLRVEVQGL